MIRWAAAPLTGFDKAILFNPKQSIREVLKKVTFMASGVSPWPVVETTKITASSCGNKL
jgi:hypothetical protein